MKEIFKQYRNTIAGLVLVFSFLVTFCLTYWTVQQVTGNSDYAIISACSLTLILFGYYMWKFINLIIDRQKTDSSDLRPRGIDKTKSVYPEVDLTKEEDKYRILYMFGHADEVNKKLIEGKRKVR